MSPSPPGDRTPLDRTSTAVALILVLAGIVVRVLAILNLRVNTDEPQHLHVAWAWTQGLLPYRDVFDNHTPLFSMLMAPILRLVGERPDVVVVMRFAVVPIVLVALVATWIVARRLFSPRVATWAVALVAVNPEFLRASIEYRTDQLWMAAWLSALAVMVAGRPTRGRALAGGFLLGVAVSTSMKTSVLVLSLVVAVIATALLLAREGRRVPAATLAGRAAWVGCGMALLPAALGAYFAARGVWPQLVYGVVWHNLVPGLGMWRSAPWRPLLIVALVPVLWWVARMLLRRAPSPRLGALRAALFIGVGLSHGLIEGFWPLVTRADLLPLLPIETMFLAALLFDLPRLGPRLVHRPRLAGALAAALAWAPVGLLGAQTVAAATEGAVWIDRTQPDIEVMRQVLKFTTPGDLVMDVKGESIFRRRPYYLALETITEERFNLGLLRDDIPEQLIASGTPVFVQRNLIPFPPRARAFIERNYLPVGWLRVAGVRIDRPPGDLGDERFDVEIPQRYALLSASGPARGWLDGAPYQRPVTLAHGWHSYRPGPGEGRVVLIWGPAVDRGLPPPI